ncbi:uncharacterized protein LOC117605204 isoform X2 [Osmia lignaria lignaria]|uniref:uncharacterized protein LOC117605204 isoform X2 n=1 Tax=Osmia lignaria lignaria TaxID=1437193 RepID=UPI00402B6F91
MLCCVSRKAVAGADLGPPYDHCPLREQPVESEIVVEIEQYTDPDVQGILQPCAICARTFKPQSLEKHSKICERAANKKRKPFDSSKQRIQGTELAEFLPKQEKKRYVSEDRLSKPAEPTWKQNHDEFLRAIRAARNEITDFTMQKPCGTTVTSSAPTRSNEQGACPTCNRHFGVKAYDRHVAWCKDRIAHVPVSPATNIAKERLEARMKYRAPAVKSRRQVTREKYSPSSAITLNSASKTSPNLATVKAKECASAPNCNKSNDSPVKHKPLGRRSAQTKEPAASHVPMKSRPIDRTNRPAEDKPGTLSLRPAPPVKRISYLPVPPLKHTRDILEETDIIPSPTSCKKRSRKVQERAKREEITSYRSKQEEKYSARSPKTNIVSTRSQGNPKVNDVSINDIVGVTVKPCNIYRENSYTTWKQISQEKICESNSNQKMIKPQKLLEDHDKKDDALKIDFNEDTCKDDNDKLSCRSESLNWTMISSKLNQTYSFKDLNEEIENARVSKRRKPVKHSPRVEFCLGDLEKANRLRSALNFNYPDESNVNKVSRTSSKNEFKRTSSKGSVIENETERLPEEGNFESARSRILERKRLTPTTYADVSSQNDYQVESNVDEITNLQEGFEKDEKLNGINIINCEDIETVSTHENNDSNEENWEEVSRHSEERLKPNEFINFSEMCQLGTNDIIVDDDIPRPHQSKLQEGTTETTDSEDIKEDNDQLISDVRNLDGSLQNNITDDDPKSCNIATNFVEMENDEISKDILWPTRSSTPFVNIEDCSNKKSENTEESCQAENEEWQMAINLETGSELLYRVESRDSHCSGHSSRGNSRKKILELENCPSVREMNTSVKSFSSLPSVQIQKNEEESCSFIRSPIILKEEQFESDKTFRKEIASQINMCNCPSNLSGILKLEKGIDCNDLIENISESEAELCDTKLKEFNRPLKEVEFSEGQSKENLQNNNCKEERIDDKDLIKESNTEIQEIYKNDTAKDFDYDSDNSIEQHVKEAISNLKASSKKQRSIILSKSRVKVKKSRTSKSYRSKILDIPDKIHEDPNVLNESTDSLSSSNNGADFTDVKRVESVEVETIEEIGTRNRSIRFRILPEIKGSTVVVKENYGEREKIDTYWEKASRASKNRLINLDPPYQGASRFFKRNPKVRTLPPVPSGSSLIDYRNLKLPLRPVWSNYVRRRPDFNLVLSGRTGKDYDPFVLAEQQMNDLLSDTSEQSVTDSPSIEQNRETSFPLSHSSAFVKYPCHSSLSSPEKRSSLIAPPSEFDDLVSDFSSDSTETNSLSREIFLDNLKDPKESKESKESIGKSGVEKKSPIRELGRRVIIDKSKALGNDAVDDGNRGSRSFVGSSERARKILDKVSPKVIRPSVNRSVSVRASSAPKTTPDRNMIEETKKSRKGSDAQRCSSNSLNNRNNNYANLSSSNLSLSSIVSSDMEMKRSNSLFDELMTSFEDENGSFSSLKSLLKNDSLSSPVHGRQRNGQISDEELSSPESYKRQDRSKLSADSAYSSLNRKYSHHGRSTNDVAGRLEEDLPRCKRREADGLTGLAKCKMSKFCHECGSKFPKTAKFCCECGVRRLVL